MLKRPEIEPMKLFLEERQEAVIIGKDTRAKRDFKDDLAQPFHLQAKKLRLSVKSILLPKAASFPTWDRTHDFCF